MFSKQINFSINALNGISAIPNSIDRYYDWVRYRTTRKYHIIRIPTLKPGYYDVDTRLLHGMFSLLVDFVELECAWMTKLNRQEFDTSFFRRIKRRFFPTRSRELGLIHLDWEINLHDDDCGQTGSWSQSSSAVEIKELYLWWKDQYLNRKEPEDCLPPDEYKEWHDWLHSTRFEKQEDGNSRMIHDCTEEQNERGHELNKKVFQIEENQHKEDEEMMIRLVKLHRCLWT